jgi:hypothetical protein
MFRYVNLNELERMVCHLRNFIQVVRCENEAEGYRKSGDLIGATSWEQGAKEAYERLPCELKTP